MPTDQFYIQFSIVTTKPADAELLVAVLSAMGIEGFEEQDELLIASGKMVEIEEAVIADWLGNNGYGFTTNNVLNQNWNAAWESSFEPVKVNDFAVIRAEFHEPVQGVLHDIIITPKMSFGTGHHATTWLMVQEMSQVDFQGKKVIDFGTGTGVLAILAAKLGASEVYAIDIDEWSIENAMENILLNQVSGILVERKDAIDKLNYASILLANINKNVLLSSMQQMANAVTGGGIWVLSGLLEKDEADIRMAAETVGMQHLHTTAREGWISMKFERC